MILVLIINFLAIIGALTLAITALTLWAYFSDESNEHFEDHMISDEEVHEMSVQDND